MPARYHAVRQIASASAPVISRGCSITRVAAEMQHMRQDKRVRKPLRHMMATTDGTGERMDRRHRPVCERLTGANCAAVVSKE
jgi:hypothetical protein